MKKIDDLTLIVIGFLISLFCLISLIVFNSPKEKYLRCMKTGTLKECVPVYYGRQK